MIKGIDGQVMIQRTVEYARQAADQANNAVLSQEFASHLQKDQAARDVNSVAKSEEAEGKRINDEQKRNNGGDEEKPEKESSEAEPQPKPKKEILDDVSKLEVGYAPERRLDIEV